jgi:hypothetical protein|tara:strand:- start:242 stop:448 length:207 start_codon:yes stop_codon:yes gene_type:complete
MIKVEGHPHLYRDERTGAIINCDDIGYDQYVKSQKLRKNQKEEIQNMKKDIDEIKSLLKILVEGNNNT